MKSTLGPSLICLLALIGMTCHAHAESLSLERYLNSVRQNNEAIRGAIDSSEGALERSNESSLLFAPSLFSKGQFVDDERQTAVPASQGTETKIKSGEIGLSQVTRYGLAGKISYSLNQVNISGTNPLYLPQPVYTDSAVKLELILPLWQNGLGQQYRMAERAGHAAAKATSLAKKYEAQALLLDAELKYWKLASIRETIRILKENVDQTAKLLEFNRTKFRRHLTDATDYLQSEATLKARQLDLNIAESEEKDALRVFNLARNESDAPTLVIPSINEIQYQLETLTRNQERRNDILAAEAQLRAIEATSEMARDKTRPDVSLFTSGSLNARENETDDAAQHAMRRNHTNMAVGIQVSIPLNFSLSSSVREGYAKEVNGARRSLQQKFIDSDSDWNSIVTRARDYRERLQLAKDLREAQSLKLAREKERQETGRSTMFQIFAFEQEHLASRLNVVQIQTQALALIAQSKLFTE